jgi:NAD(P)-dependent dehydrogenase (short-subunit alcohol dehydrogenase family)
VAGERRRTLVDQVVVVTGASRGIGREIAVRVAADGARVAILARTEAPNPKIAGTLRDTVEAVEEAGGDAVSVPCDVPAHLYDKRARSSAVLLGDASTHRATLAAHIG